MKKPKMDRMNGDQYSDGLHQMIRLTYISQADKGVKANDLKSILTKARSKNQARGITGILVFNNSYFLQSIEGSRPIINDLLRELSIDKRHFNLQVVYSEEIQERFWSKWFMDYVTPNVKNRATFLKYSSDDIFNPYLMKASVINRMLIELSSAHKAPENEVSSTSESTIKPESTLTEKHHSGKTNTSEEKVRSQRKIFGLF